MDFSSLSFWGISIPALLLYFFICRGIRDQHRQRRFSKYSLCVLSICLLAQASILTVTIFLFVSILAYVSCRYIRHHSVKRRKLLLAILIFFLLLPLMYYKYSIFIVQDVLCIPWNTYRNLIIPIGISFYTFQIISFCIDTIKREQDIPSFIDYMNFCSFFPQIVAGPIERKDSLLPQMENYVWRWNSNTVANGFSYIVLGLFFKMALADNLASVIDNGYQGHNAFRVWANNLMFGLRIYFDFAGYGLTAYGIAKALGVNITLNFNSPYTSCNVTDFWRKWHISLTLWFRDYIYFAMGGSRTRFWWFNIIFMFIISGIWHGAGWNFLIWGAIAGVSMVLHRLYRKLNYAMPAFIAWGLTMFTMMFTWMFFYETDMGIVWKNLYTIVTPSSYDLHDYLENAGHPHYILISVLLSALVIFVEFISSKKYQDPYHIFLSPPVCGILVFLICFLQSHQQAQFIYFAF